MAEYNEQRRNDQPATTCPTCGTTVRGRPSDNRIYCSNKCRGIGKRTKQRRPAPPKLELTACIHCGTTLAEPTTSKTKAYCNNNCRNRQSYLNYKDTYIRNAHIRRARLITATVENINPTTVFERDRWTCQLCGEPTVQVTYPKGNGTGRTKRHPLMASIDHKIPISQGGSHSYDNVQCAHLKCNMSKNNKVDLPLEI